MCGTPDFGSLTEMTYRIIFTTAIIGISATSHAVYQWLSKLTPEKMSITTLV